MEILVKGAIKNFTVDDPWVDVKVEYYDNTKGVVLNKEELKIILDALKTATDKFCLDDDLDNPKFFEMAGLMSDISDAISNIK